MNLKEQLVSNLTNPVVIAKRIITEIADIVSNHDTTRMEFGYIPVDEDDLVGGPYLFTDIYFDRTEIFDDNIGKVWREILRKVENLLQKDLLEMGFRDPVVEEADDDSGRIRVTFCIPRSDFPY